MPAIDVLFAAMGRSCKAPHLQELIGQIHIAFQNG